MKKRNKFIRLADRSTGGWMTVQEYVPDELASDSDDSKKCAKRKTGQPKGENLHFQRNLCQRFHLLPSFTSPL